MRYAALLALAILMVGLFAAPGLAAEKVKKIQEEVNLTDENRVAYTEIQISENTRITGKKPSGDVTAAYTPGEKEYTVTYTARNIYGEAIYKFNTRVYWRWDSTRITYVSRYTWGSTYKTGWTYIGSTQTGNYYNNYQSYYHRADGTFRFGYGIYYYEHPWIEMRVHAGGGVTYTGGS